MNILIISHYAGSPSYGMAYRPYYMAKEWVKLGHRVRIAASSFSHLRGKQPDVNLSKKVNYEDIEGIDYVWLTTPPYKGNGVKRFINILCFIYSLIRNKRQVLEGFNPDVVIASSTYPLDIYPSYLIAKSNKAQLMFEVHDLWPLSPIEIGGMSRWNPFIILLQWAENFAYKRSDKVVSMLPKTIEHMKAHGMSPEKFNYIPNGIDRNEWELTEDKIPDEIINIVKELRNKKRFVIGYTGYHGSANALEYVVEAMSILRDKPVSLIMVGDGPEKARLQKKVEYLNLNNVFFVKSVSKTFIPGILSTCDVLFIGWQRNPIYRFGICPNKLIDYMMSAKPVIHSVEAGNDIVAESGCGISIKPENPKLISDAILELMNMSDNEREKMGLKGREYVLKHHDNVVLANRFVEILTNNRG